MENKITITRDEFNDAIHELMMKTAKDYMKEHEQDEDQFKVDMMAILESVNCSLYLSMMEDYLFGNEEETNNG